MLKANIVIPTVGKNEMIVNLLHQIRSINDNIIKNIYVFDNGMPDTVRLKCLEFNVEIISSHGDRIYQMWNKGVVKSMQDEDIEYVCIFNDDLILDIKQDWFKSLLEPLKEESIWATCGNYNHYIHDENLDYKQVTGTYKDNGFAGFCFAIAKDAFLSGLPFFDERFNWWYGDDDFVHNVHKLNKATAVSCKAKMVHIDGGSKTVVQYTPEFNQMVEEDRIYYMEKWHNE
jgi:GT2 family glycosyltransferase